MPNDPVKQSLNLNFAQSWYDEFKTNSSDNYFMVFARTNTWGGSGDVSPPIALDTVNHTFQTWRDSIGAKRIRRADAYHVLPRYDWKSGTVYDEYDPDVELFQDTKPSYDPAYSSANWPKQFYVFTNENHVYKCISNNGGDIGNPSTNQPVGTSTNIFQTSDGYRWKFMFKVPEDLDRFITDDYIPVEYITALSSEEQNTERRLQWDVQEATIDGEIEHISVTSRGNAFVRSVPYSPGRSKIGRIEYGTTDPRIDVLGTGITGGDVRAELILNSESKFSSQIEDYYNGYSVVISSGSGAGQVRHITGYDSVNRRCLLDRPFTQTLSTVSSCYSIVPKCDIRGDGTGAEAVVSLYPIEYEEWPTGSSSQLYSKFQVIEQIDMVSGGIGYTTGTAEIYPRGRVIDSPSNPPKAKVMISPKGGHGNNPVKELDADKVMVVLTFDQDGAGDLHVGNDFRAVAIIKNPRLGGTVVESPTGTYQLNGSNAQKIAGTESPVDTILTIDALSGTEYNDASFTTGHYLMGETSRSTAAITNYTYDLSTKTFGYLTVESVVGDFITDNSSLIYPTTGERIGQFVITGGATGGIFPVFSFTTGGCLGKIRSSLPYQNDSPLRYQLYHVVDVNAVDGQDPLTSSTYELDDLVVGETSGVFAYVLDWDTQGTGTTGQLKLAGVEGSFVTGENIYDSEDFLPPTSDRSYSLSTAPKTANIVSIRQPELIRGSGEVVYIQHMRPITRNFEQDEDIKIILGF